MCDSSHLNEQLAYTSPSTRQTLAEGLSEYYAHMEGLLDPESLSGVSQELFRLHDTAHVVFGCDTSLRDEVLIDVWTIFGSDVGVWAYAQYLRVPEARDIVTDTGGWHMLTTLVRSLPDIVSTVRHARRMKQKWPWRDHDAYLDRPLAEIRRELGIEILTH